MPRNYYPPEQVVDDSSVKADVSSLLSTPLTPEFIFMVAAILFFLYYGVTWGYAKLVKKFRKDILLPQDPADQKAVVKAMQQVSKTAKKIEEDKAKNAGGSN